MGAEDITRLRLSPVEQGETNVTKLRDYLNELRRTGQDVPRRRNGAPNITEIGKACGVPRGVLHTNKAALRLLHEYLGGGDGKSEEDQRGPHSEAHATQIALLEQRLMRLEQKLAVVTVERDELRTQLSRYQVVEEVLKSGRRFNA